MARGIQRAAMAEWESQSFVGIGIHAARSLRIGDLIPFFPAGCEAYGECFTVIVANKYKF